jgi:hypothetical protein
VRLSFGLGEQVCERTLYALVGWRASDPLALSPKLTMACDRTQACFDCSETFCMSVIVVDEHYLLVDTRRFRQVARLKLTVCTIAEQFHTGVRQDHQRLPGSQKPHERADGCKPGDATGNDDRQARQGSANSLANLAVQQLLGCQVDRGHTATAQLTLDRAARYVGKAPALGHLPFVLRHWLVGWKWSSACRIIHGCGCHLSQHRDNANGNG